MSLRAVTSLPADLLRSHVGRRATAHVLDFVRHTGQAEIHDKDFAAAIEHDVRWLQIAVQYAFVVRSRQPGANLAGDLDSFVGGQAADAAQQRGEIFAIHVLHGEEDLVVGLPDVVNAADVGVRDAARDADFVAEALQRVLVRHGLRQELEGDGLAEAKIVGAINFSHAPTAQQRDDAIALG